MDIVLLRAVCKNLLYFNDGQVDIDFIAEKRVYRYESDEHLVSHLFNNIYKLNVLSFIGINASGKTTTIKLLSAILQMYLGNASLSRDMDIAKCFAGSLEVETYYYDKARAHIYKLVSTIYKEKKSETLYFDQEYFYTKKVTAQTNRHNLFQFCDADLEMVRTDMQNEFLKPEDSVFSGVMNRSKSSRKAARSIIDMCQSTNYNRLYSLMPDLIVPFVNYLDPSIEQFEVDRKTPDKFKLKFTGSPKRFTVNVRDLDDYLSSGTIKGLTCLSNIVVMLRCGGYLLIDEIENHLNKTIVISMINMFSGPLNRYGATLLFTTHYSEILDSIDRSDSIYMLSKSTAMSLDKFSHLANRHDRKDKKRSDLILSGALHSAPSYTAYKTLINSITERLQRGNVT